MAGVALHDRGLAPCLDNRIMLVISGLRYIRRLKMIAVIHKTSQIRRWWLEKPLSLM